MVYVVEYFFENMNGSVIISSDSLSKIKESVSYMLDHPSFDLCTLFPFLCHPLKSFSVYKLYKNGTKVRLDL